MGVFPVGGITSGCGSFLKMASSCTSDGCADDSAANTTEDTSHGASETTTNPQIRHDWYQTDSTVVVSVLTKTLRAESVDVRIEETLVRFSAELAEDGGRRAFLRLHLARPVVPSRSSWKQSQSKVEIRLEKSVAGFWKSLEKSPSVGSAVEAALEGAAAAFEPKLEYPSSNAYRRNWDKIAVDIDRVEEEEAKAMTGEASVNKLLQEIYWGGSEEVKRAMNKSFMESGGTVLSTNWNEVQKSQVKVKPPEGMEFKKWDE